MERNYNEVLKLQLTVNEAYALQSIFISLRGLIKDVCQNYNVDSQAIYDRLEALTDLWLDSQH